MTPEQHLKAIEDAFLAYFAGDTEVTQFVRAVEAALRAWRGYR
jgi:hypothetical protein